MKILLIDDNIDISNNIKKVLELDNPDFSITQVFDWEEAIKSFLLNKYDLILLDLMLPKIDWITLCKRIRQTSNIPIIMMTAKWDDDDKILWLESWADDYIVKPFKIRELQARIKSISKRVNIDKIIKLWNCEIDFTNKIVKLNGKIIHFKLKEIQILEYIYNKKTVSKTDLISYIWWDDDLFWDDNKIDVYIYSIRKKIGKDKIKTIKWFGYSIINENEN